MVAIVISGVFGARSDLHLAERVQLEGCPDWTGLRTRGRAMVVTCQQQGSPKVVPCFINYIPLIGIIFYKMITMPCGKRLETGDWNHELITQTVFWGNNCNGEVGPWKDMRNLITTTSMSMFNVFVLNFIFIVRSYSYHNWNHEMIHTSVLLITFNRCVCILSTLKCVHHSCLMIIIVVCYCTSSHSWALNPLWWVTHMWCSIRPYCALITHS